MSFLSFSVSFKDPRNGWLPTVAKLAQKGPPTKVREICWRLVLLDMMHIRFLTCFIAIYQSIMVIDNLYVQYIIHLYTHSIYTYISLCIPRSHLSQHQFLFSRLFLTTRSGCDVSDSAPSHRSWKSYGWRILFQWETEGWSFIEKHM